ncbi:MAG TPA: 30S ribosomal protein S20 [Candidatus Peribacteraceae bacterium]|nr:30S ribosomal protein S20 [Candidatus Peribacteraceae bacterium]
MPITPSAIKRARQNLVRRERLQPYKTHMKTMMRKISDAVKAGKKDDAAKLLPQVYKSIDTAAKKNLIHSRTASRKKSLVARMVGAK